MNPFDGKSVLITGGSSGIGLSIAKQLAANGANICILARTLEQLKIAQVEIQKSTIRSNQRVEVIQADVADESIMTLLSDYFARQGTPDFVFNAAGVVQPGMADSQEMKDYHWMMDIDFFGTVHVVKAVLPGMLQRGNGYIINISSAAGFLGPYGYTGYGAAKFAVRGYTDALRAELRPRGIRVSLVCPTDVDTPQYAYESKYKPEVSRIMWGEDKMKVEDAARSIIRGVASKHYMITPGFSATAMWIATQIVGYLAYPIMDFLVDNALHQISTRRK